MSDEINTADLVLASGQYRHLKKISIDKGIPIPSIPYGRKRQFDYPFKTMDVGDSFLIPAGGIRYSSVGSLIRRYREILPGRDWTMRKEDAGLRIWRIA